MENVNLKHETPADANNVLVAGDIVVIKFIKGEYVIRRKDHDDETMIRLLETGNMRNATQTEKEFWCHSYATTEYCGVNLEGLSYWLKWRDTVACR